MHSGRNVTPGPVHNALPTLSARMSEIRYGLSIVEKEVAERQTRHAAQITMFDELRAQMG